MHRILAALCAAFFTFVAAPAMAATAGLVRGNVLVNNAPKAAVHITLRGDQTLYNADTDASGNYVFPQVPFGHYTLTAHSAGVADKSFGIDVSSDDVMTVNVALGDLKIIASANVTSHAGITGTPVSGNILSRSQLGALPVNNSLNRIVQTVPGIVRFSYDEPVAHGFHGVTYEVDGAPLPQATSSNFSEIIDPKNVDSVEVFTGAFPAEYGGSRQGAVINIVTSRANDLKGSQGFMTFGGGNDGQALMSVNEGLKFGKTELFFNANSQHTTRGLDTPTFDPQHDNASQSDQFLRVVTPVGERKTLAFDYSNQLAQFQIPINTAANNPNDPVVNVPGTDDVQREYDRYANLNFTAVSKEGTGVFQAIPWYRYTRIAYDGDLANDVLATLPDPNTGLPVNMVGLRQDRAARYVGLRLSQLWASKYHALKIGADISRETLDAKETFAQFGQPNVSNATDQSGSQTGIYVQDKWTPSRAISLNAGLRYDHSTGFTGDHQLSPRIGLNIAPDGKNIVHFYYGRLYAAPGLEDVRQACVLLSGCPTEPVYDLKPEKDAYWEMGVAHTFSASVTGYVNYFNRAAVNVLDTTQLLNTPLFAVFNNRRGRDEGVEFRLQGKIHANADSWFLSTTFSSAQAQGVSGSTFLFSPDDVSNNSWQPEDHDQTVAANAAYTHRFGAGNKWFATLQGEYGTGFPVEFESGDGRLPSHTTFNLGIGRDPSSADHSLGFSLDLDNALNHEYIIKIANGFNTTQISSGRKVLLRLTAPL